MEHLPPAGAEVRTLLARGPSLLGANGGCSVAKRAVNSAEPLIVF
jgi:hypothetical protein